MRPLGFLSPNYALPLGPTKQEVAKVEPSIWIRNHLLLSGTRALVSRIAGHPAD